MHKLLLPFLFLFFFQTKALRAEKITIADEELFYIQYAQLNTVDLTDRPLPNLQKFLDKLQRKRKITAAALAFPLPFGIIGLHRLYLGTQPYVPLVYIATVGGAFGILPIVDFGVILGKKDISELMNNKNVFMWIK